MVNRYKVWMGIRLVDGLSSADVPCISLIHTPTHTFYVRDSSLDKLLLYIGIHRTLCYCDKQTSCRDVLFSLIVIKFWNALSHSFLLRFLLSFPSTRVFLPLRLSPETLVQDQQVSWKLFTALPHGSRWNW